MVEMPRSRTCVRSPTLWNTNVNVRPSSRPAGSASPLPVTDSQSNSEPDADSVPRCSSVVEIDADERIAARRRIRPRRHRRRHRGTRCALPRRRSGRPRAHVVGHRWGLRRFNRHELPATTPDWVTSTIGHSRRSSTGDLAAFFRATWDLTPQTQHLHRGCAPAQQFWSSRHPHGSWDLSGRLRCRVAADQPSDGRGDLINRCEIFDEADLDAAIARFEELQSPARLLKNAASATHARLTACVAAHDWNAISEILAEDIAIDDRRRVVNSGITYGRDAALANMGGVVDVGTHEYFVDRHCDPRRSSRPLSYVYLGPGST